MCLKRTKFFLKYINIIFFADILPDALKTACSKCTEKQKVGSEKVFKYLLDNKRDDYEVLERQFDPTGIYRKKYAQEAKKHGVHV